MTPPTLSSGSFPILSARAITANQPHDGAAFSLKSRRDEDQKNRTPIVEGTCLPAIIASRSRSGSEGDKSPSKGPADSTPRPYTLSTSPPKSKSPGSGARNHHGSGHLLEVPLLILNSTAAVSSSPRLSTMKIHQPVPKLNFGSAIQNEGSEHQTKLEITVAAPAPDQTYVDDFVPLEVSATLKTDKGDSKSSVTIDDGKESVDSLQRAVKKATDAARDCLVKEKESSNPDFEIVASFLNHLTDDSFFKKIQSSRSSEVSSNYVKFSQFFRSDGAQADNALKYMDMCLNKLKERFCILLAKKYASYYYGKSIYLHDRFQDCYVDKFLDSAHGAELSKELFFMACMQGNIPFVKKCITHKDACSILWRVTSSEVWKKLPLDIATEIVIKLRDDNVSDNLLLQSGIEVVVQTQSSSH